MIKLISGSRVGSQKSDNFEGGHLNGRNDRVPCMDETEGISSGNVDQIRFECFYSPFYFYPKEAMRAFPRSPGTESPVSPRLANVRES